MKFLISYAYRNYSNSTVWEHGYDTADDPVEWVLSMQQYEDTYILLGAWPMTAEQFERADGALKGM